MVFPIAFSEIYALYGKTPKVKIPLKKAPLYPVILGVKVFSKTFKKYLTYISKIYGAILSKLSVIFNYYIK